MSQGLAYRAGLQYLINAVPGATTPAMVRWRGRSYQRAGVCYAPITDEAVEAILAAWLARNPGARTDGGRVQAVTKNFLRDALLAVRAETLVADQVASGSWINPAPAGGVGPYLATDDRILDLGRLDGSGAAQMPADAGFFTLTALPVTPDASAPCAAWLEFLGETFPGDQAAVQLLQEMFGYCLWPDCRYEKFFLLYGPGSTGKSTVAEVLQSVLGEGNVGSLPLERFGERFALSGLVGKVANVVFDALDVDRTAEGSLKAMVSGEPVTVEQKHCPVHSARLTAKHVFVTNNLLRFHDTSDGLWRRLILLPFESVCPVEKRDAGLKTRLRRELPGIAHWALLGLARLRDRGEFTTSPRGAKLGAEYREESNPVATFVAQECDAGRDARVGRKDLYARYRGYADENGFEPAAAMKFYREVRSLHPQPDEEVRDGRGGDRMFVGIRLRDAGGDVMGQFRLIADGLRERA